MISVIIATYGDTEWPYLAVSRPLPSLVRQDSHDVVLKHEREGTRATSLNNGAKQAAGDWLIFLDADDELAPGYVKAMAAQVFGIGLLQPEAVKQMLFTPAVQHIRKGRPSPPNPVFMDRGISLRDDNWLVIGTMIHRDLFNRVGGFDEYPHGFEDWALWSKCFRVGATVVKVPDAIYRYHHNPQSAHKRMWRDRKRQVQTHQRIKAELDAWEAAL